MAYLQPDETQMALAVDNDAYYYDRIYASCGDWRRTVERWSQHDPIYMAVVLARDLVGRPLTEPGSQAADIVREYPTIVNDQTVCYAIESYSPLRLESLEQTVQSLITLGFDRRTMTPLFDIVSDIINPPRYSRMAPVTYCDDCLRAVQLLRGYQVPVSTYFLSDANNGKEGPSSTFWGDVLNILR